MNNLVKSNSSLDEPLEKRELERAISEKEKILVVILEKVEQLKIDLSILKQEYDIKIGRLYLRLDEVDLEILKFKKIEDLIAQGFSFSDAQKIVEETLKTRREQIREEYHRLEEEEKDFDRRKIMPVNELEELKQLWRKLAHRYHPDLPHGDAEMMKRINKAYAGGDLETLRAIDHEQFNTNSEVTTIESMKLKLVTLEKSIEKANDEFKTLESSEWSILSQNIENALQQKRDLLNELADKVLNEIAQKENQIEDLKNKYG